MTLNETAVVLDAETSETFQIGAQRKGDGAISYASNNENIATVSETGLVTAVGRGTAVITVSVAETEAYDAASKKLTVTVSGPINWDALSWVENSNEKYKVAAADGQTVVNVQKPGFADEDGIYTTFPAGISSCSLPEGKYAIQGAGIVLYLSAFTDKVTEVRVVADQVNYDFSVFYVDGKEATAIDIIKEGTRARKAIENGNVVIIRDGVKFNILGVQVK